MTYFTSSLERAEHRPAKVFEFGTPDYDELLPVDKRQPGSRAAIWIDVHKVGSVSLPSFVAPDTI